MKKNTFIHNYIYVVLYCKSNIQKIDVKNIYNLYYNYIKMYFEIKVIAVEICFQNKHRTLFYLCRFL